MQFPKFSFLRNVLQRADKLLIFTQKIVYTAAKGKPTQRAHNKSLSLGEPPPPLLHNQGLGLTWLTRSWASDLQLRAAARQITSLQYYCRILVDFQNITVRLFPFISSVILSCTLVYVFICRLVLLFLHMFLFYHCLTLVMLCFWKK